MRAHGWDTALDAQTDLINSNRTREGRKYLEGLADSMGRAGGYDVSAGASREGGDEEDINFAHLYVNTSVEVLNRCEPVYVGEEIIELIDAASGKFKPEPIFEPDLFCPHGFAFFEKPLVVTDGRDHTFPFRAIQWNTCRGYKRGDEMLDIEKKLLAKQGKPLGDVTAGEDEPIDVMANKLALLIGIYQHRDDDPMAYGAPMGLIGGSALSLAHVIVLEFGDEGVLAERSTRDMLTQVKVFFRLAAQEIAVGYKERVQRPVWKRAATWKQIKQVTVFTLRRAKPREYLGERDVEWTHRWMVNGHWRNQPYVEHTDDGEKRVIYRQIWIAPYVKGPDDKPLILKHRAFEFVR